MVLKNHFTMTADRAALAMAQVEGLEIFGGVALNRAIGGINPEAVRQMVAFDGGRGKVVWLPTFDAEFYVTRAGGPEPFVRIVEDGVPVAPLVDVFSLVAEHDPRACDGPFVARGSACDDSGCEASGCTTHLGHSCVRSRCDA